MNKKEIFSELERIRNGYEPQSDSSIVWIIYTINGVFSLILLRMRLWLR